MYNIFIFTTSLLFLISCSDEKTVSNNDNKQSYIVIKKTNEASEDDASKQEESPQSVIVTEEVHEADNLNNSSTPEQKPFVHMVTFNINSNDMVLGNKEASVVLVEYFSSTCPHCAHYKTTIFPKLKEKYIDTNKVAYVMREFVSSKQDLDAAILARCNGDVNSFLKFHSVMLQRQESWAYSQKYRELLTDIAQVGGLSVESYQKCLADNKIAEILIANTNFISKSPGFRGTPAFYINGIQLEKAHNIENLSSMIDEALSKSEK